MFSLKRCSPDLIFKETEKSEKIVYVNNGNRSSNAQSFLRKIVPIMPFIGVTRIAEISQLAVNSFPVYQTTRPHVFAHTRIGQNTGAQGKGNTLAQAKISCLMETVENFCLEPREIHVVRGSFNSLKQNHVICPPQWFLHQSGVKTANPEEPLMWTEVASLELKEKVLAPAEAIYCPFFARDYKTRSIYCASSNGVAAGSSYLEALNHALFEVIERHYLGLHEENKVKAEALFENEIKSRDIVNFIKTLGGEFEIQIYTLTIPNTRNMPMIKCALVGADTIYFGYGCCANVDTAIDRAVSEALQSYAVVASGSREDISGTIARYKKGSKEFKGRHPGFRTLSLSAYKRNVINKNFSDLRDELKQIRQWLYDNGFNNILVANLTHEKMPLAVVKVLVPGLKNEYQTMGRVNLSSSIIQNLRFFLS